MKFSVVCEFEVDDDDLETMAERFCDKPRTHWVIRDIVREFYEDDLDYGDSDDDLSYGYPRCEEDIADEVLKRCGLTLADLD